eukprot:5395208-Alexandrium_andersonii.AAC.1
MTPGARKRLGAKVAPQHHLSLSRRLSHSGNPDTKWWPAATAQATTYQVNSACWLKTLCVD